MGDKNRTHTYVDPDDILGDDLNRDQDLRVVKQELSEATDSFTEEGANGFRGLFTAASGSFDIDTHTHIDGSGDFDWRERMVHIRCCVYAAAADMPGGASDYTGPTGVYEGTLFTGAGGAWAFGASDCYIEIAPDIYIYAWSSNYLLGRNETGGTAYLALDIRVDPQRP
jgi:hypothetical protein